MKIQSTFCKDHEHRVIRAEDFAPWSYNLHYIIAAEPWTYRHHRHHGCFELVYTISGRVEHLLDGSWRAFSEGDLLAVGEEDYHSIRGDAFSYANLILPTAVWEERTAALGVGDPLGNPRACGGLTVNLSSSRCTEAEVYLDRLFRFQQTVEGERQLQRFLGFLIYQAYWTETAEEAEIAESDAPAWWTDFVCRIDAEGLLPADPRMMAEMAGRSREHVARTCRKVTGLSPSAWLNARRLQRAELLLRKSNQDITDIAYALGFGSLPHFYRLFKERYGIPPKRYRALHGDAH